MLDPNPPAGGGPAAMTVVDAGGEPWERVEPLLARRMEELPPGTVLELLSTEPQVCEVLPGWCAERVHAVYLGVPVGDASVFRIHKDALSPLELA
ncbi:sulfurtransferase TusA family protein [Streptomyces wedmorensis]|uniref:sulfurtransferase TusA family protein n=1 Tax=Streptomyces wedmorensis TaxID=43759 RepID=UPI00378F22A9